MSHSKKLNWTFSSGGLISESVISTKSGFSSDLFHVEADFKNIIYFSETHAPHMWEQRGVWIVLGDMHKCT